MNRRIRQILGWAALLCGLYVLVAGALLSRGLDRVLTTGLVLPPSAPRAAVTDPLRIGYRGTPTAAFGLPYEEVRYASPLGPMPAWFVPARQPAAPDVAAIYVHGLGGVRDHGSRHLAMMNAGGVPMLLINYRNDEGAPADPSGRRAMGMTEWQDLDGAITWLRARGYRRIIVIGESMGGGIVGQWLKRSRQAKVATALVLDAPALDTPAIVTNIARLRHLPAPGVVGRVTLAMLDARTGVPLSQADSRDAVADFPGPLLLAHGETDTAVPVTISDELERRRRVGTVYLRGQAGHLLMYAEDPPRYRDAVGRLVATVTKGGGPPDAVPAR